MPQNFSSKNLRGRSFKNQDLAGANFSHADIRGANFTHAILTGANFSNVKAGQQRRWRVGVAIIALTLAVVFGYFAGYAGVGISSLMIEEGQPEVLVVSVIALMILATVIVITLKQGLGRALGTFAIAITVIIAAIAVGDYRNVIAAIFVLFLVVAIALACIVMMAITVAVVRLIAKISSVLVVGILSLVSAVPGALEAVDTQIAPEVSRELEIIAFVVGGIIVIIMIGLSTYIGWRSVAGDKKYLWVRVPAIAISSLGCTSFRGADLTDADFTQATLKGVDFTEAILKRTCWYHATKLNQARVKGTYLENPQIQQLVVSKDGRDQNFDRLDLRGLNLQNAKMQYASLMSSDLSETNLQNADLLRAKLVKTQLYQTNLTEACLTGAYIQDWNISTETQLERIKCEYVFMQLPTKADPDPCRKPDNREECFKPGDFTEFITPILKTLDLYRTQNVDMRQFAETFKTLDLFHHQGIDPSIVAITLQQLSETYPNAGLEVIALQGQGQDRIRLQARVNNDVDRSKLSAEYSEKYRENEALSYSDIQVILAGASQRDQQIIRLERILETAIQQPKFYIETYQNQGEFIMSQSKGNVNISGVQGSVSGVAAAGDNQAMTGVAIGEISGTVTNTINKLPDSSEVEQPGIKELLTQLQAAIEAESELDDEDKVEALEQVKALAEAGQNPEEGTLKKAAKTAIKIIRGTVASLPDATKLVEACSTLLPKIATLIGIVM